MKEKTAAAAILALIGIVLVPIGIAYAYSYMINYTDDVLKFTITEESVKSVLWIFKDENGTERYRSQDFIVDNGVLIIVLDDGGLGVTDSCRLHVSFNETYLSGEKLWKWKASYMLVNISESGLGAVQVFFCFQFP